MRRVGDLAPSRRGILQFGGLGLTLASANSAITLTAAATGRKATPRGTARNVLYFEISGAISHVETWDFKENEGTPKDLDVRQAAPNMYLSHRLFPHFEKQIGKFATVRSLLSHEEVHFRGQYYAQTGRQLNLAFAREIPAIGSVVSMELEPRRRPQDTFPTYMSFNLDKAFPGALSTGFLHPRHSAVDINPDSAVNGIALDQKARELLEERWRLLSALREAERGRVNLLGREMTSYEGFYAAAQKLLTDKRWPEAFQITDEDRRRYGNTPSGISCILARNALAQDAGTHYIHICHPGWDHHVCIWDKSAKASHYVSCQEFDLAFSSLVEDLSTMRSRTNPDKTLLDETLVVAMSEFGRTPGKLNNMKGRDHHNKVFPALFAGAGVKGGSILGASDSAGNLCVDTGWHRKEQPRIENVAATMYSALGIDWTKEIRDTPSGRSYPYVDPDGPDGWFPTDEISEIYG